MYVCHLVPHRTSLALSDVYSNSASLQGALHSWLVAMENAVDTEEQVSTSVVCYTKCESIFSVFFSPLRKLRWLTF